MTTQLRPAGSPPGTPYYSPGRDLLNCYPSIIRMGLNSLDPARQSEYIKAACDQLDVTDEDLIDAAGKLAATFSRLYDEDTPRTWPDAMKATGYSAVPFAVTRVLHAAIGDSFLGAAFQMICEAVTGEEVPAHFEQLAQLTAGCVEACDRFQVAQPDRLLAPQDPDERLTELQQLKLQLGLARARDKRFEQMLDEAATTIRTLRERLAQYENDDATSH